MNWTSVTKVYKAHEQPAAGVESVESSPVTSDSAKASDVTVAGERRADSDRRRSSRGLLELRARRDGVTDDRREAQRRTRRQALLSRLPVLAWLTRRTKSSS